MKMKSFKQRVLRQKENPNIYMQKVQEPKFSMTSPNLDIRFKSKTLLNKQNQQPNVPNKLQSSLNQNTFGAAKMMMRKSNDELKPNLSNKNHAKVLTKQLLQTLKNSEQKFNPMSKSNNFGRCATERSLSSMGVFSKKYMRTEECDEDEKIPIIQDCEFIRSEYGSSQNSCSEEKLHYAKSYHRPISNNKSILIHESLNYDPNITRELVTFGPSQAKNLKKFQFLKEEEKKMKKDVVNNILMSKNVQIMRSCDFQTLGNLVCVNHRNKKAKYRLNAVLTEEEEECFYCSKCAVNLAKQSFDIQEISPLDRKMIMSRQLEKQFINNSVQFKSLHVQRQEEFTNFQKRLQSLKSKILAKLSLFNQKSEEMSKNGKKIELTVSFYDNLIEILKQMRQQEIMKEENLKKQVLFQQYFQKNLNLNMKKHELSTILDNIKKTSAQISSERNKLLALKNKEFTFMFDSYIKKLASYEEALTSFEQNQLAQDIAMFDANLDSEGLDEQTIIHHIFDEMYKKLTKPKLKALGRLTNESIPVRNAKNLNKINEIESGGSSMFYCEEEEQESRPPFRILFQNCKTEEPNVGDSKILDESLNVNSSIENHGYPSVRYFKEENYLPTFNHHK